MSGGSYNYAYSTISDMADNIQRNGNCYAVTPALRTAFAKHLKTVAAACRAIEWNDSGDGDDRETELILACLPVDAELKQAIEDAETAMEALKKAIDNARETDRVLKGGRG
jgi:hypothetical protein